MQVSAQLNRTCHIVYAAHPVNLINVSQSDRLGCACVHMFSGMHKQHGAAMLMRHC